LADAPTPGKSAPTRAQSALPTTANQSVSLTTPARWRERSSSKPNYPMTSNFPGLPAARLTQYFIRIKEQGRSGRASGYPPGYRGQVNLEGRYCSCFA
jgi:hypothetical protein